MRTLTFIFFALGFQLLSGQEVIVESLQHDGIARQYRLFIPSGYDGNSSLPLVFNFHGFGSNAAEQEFYSDMNRVGESNDFFICYPDGIENSWNVGWESDDVVISDADDVGFTSALIDEISQNYSIDSERIYSCGMSNGGFMSYRLACELNDRIAAIASVTGSMAPVLAADCEPGRAFSILQFHGTNDGTVPYEGMEGLNIGIDSLFNYWNLINNCSTSPDTVEIEDINMNDGSTAQRISYVNCESNTEVVLYKIDNGGHTWPGAFLNLGVTNQDVEASEVIWDFFKDKSLNNQSTSITENEVTFSSVKVFPNPTTDVLFIESETNWEQYRLYDLNGRQLLSGKITIETNLIDARSLISGTYILQLRAKDKLITRKVHILKR